MDLNHLPRKKCDLVEEEINKFIKETEIKYE